MEGGSEDQRRTFYSCLYRALLFPEKFYEFNAQGKPVHYSPYDGKLHDGVLYTDSGFWDTFRAAHPLYNLLFPEVSAEIQQSLVNTYLESGWLPEWPGPGHRSIMIGQNSFSLLADAWVKGVRNFDAAKAVEAMVHDVTGSPMGARRPRWRQVLQRTRLPSLLQHARRAPPYRGDRQDPRICLRRFLRGAVGAGHRQDRRGGDVREARDELHQSL